MARRRHKLLRPASYYRANPLTPMELYGGIAVGVAVLGLGGYLIYQKYGTPAAAGALPAGAQVAASGAYGSAAPLFDAQGNPIPGAPLQQVGLSS
jgi:hypothetical protein